MSYRFITGLSGSGRTRAAIHYLLSCLENDSNRNFYYIVPEQFTLETQKALCDASPKGSVMEIEILSFERLSYMVFKELGLRLKTVLNDSGKNLILRKIAEDHKEELNVLRPHTRNLSYIDEVKSLISELMQYECAPKDLENILGSVNSGLLNAKAKDILLLYKEFLKFLDGNFETPETSLHLFWENIHKSDNLRDAVFVFDGFTGFTPIQNSIIERLLTVANELIFTVTINPKEDRFSEIHKDELFYMSKNMMRTIRQMDKNENESIRLMGERSPEHIGIFECQNPKEELRFVAKKITELTANGERYKSIAILTGDMERFLPYISEVFDKFKIPVFRDKTMSFDHHPLFIFLRSLSDIFFSDFSSESMLRFLRSGMLDFEEEKLDKLSNYIRATGIRGKRAYSKDFSLTPRGIGKEALMELNETRVLLMTPVLDFISKVTGEHSFSDFASYLYFFLQVYDVELKLFDEEEEGLYKLLMDNLDEIHSLLGDKKCDFTEFIEVLFSGLSGVKLGKLPKYSDMVVFGDTVRTRVSCKHLFVIGANEGVLPKISGSGGFFSEPDRIALKNFGLSLAPTESERQFQGAFYLDLLMKRPEKSLFISYSRADSSGEGLRPSFILDDMKDKNPGVYTVNVETDEGIFLVGQRSRKTDINETILNIIPGELKVSVSQLETYANCSYGYFLKYILGLNEEVVYGLKSADYGNIYHDSIYNYFLGIKEKNLDISNLKESMMDEILNESVKLSMESVFTKGDYTSETDRYTFLRVRDTLKRTIKVLSNQIAGGDFKPESFEANISAINGKEQLKLALDSGEMVTLSGKIDRIDLMEKKDCLYVKIIDYKSGNTKLDLSRLNGGLQIQLLYYLDAKTKALMKEHPDKEILPSCVFYYHVDNPKISLSKDDAKEAIERAFARELRPNGLILNKTEVLSGLDRGIDLGCKYDSNLVNISTNKDGSLAKNGDYIEEDDFRFLLDFVTEKVRENANNIKSGNFKKNPYRLLDDTGCKYCPYKAVCGFDVGLGDRYRDIKKIKDIGELKELKGNGLKVNK